MSNMQTDTFPIPRLRRLSILAALVMSLALVTSLPCPAAPGLDARGVQFLSFTRFGQFERSPGNRSRETVLTSPAILSRVGWHELIASWDAEMPEGTYLKVEARALYPEGATPYYIMGLWSSNTNHFPRESVPGQHDDWGSVATDTLLLRRGASRLQMRLTLGSDSRLQPKLKMLGLCLTDTNAHPQMLPPNRAAWGLMLPVPERSQMGYPEGSVLCSPTTVSMIMSYWSQRLKRPELDRDVPQIVGAVYDAKWKGTGNWPFNTAYAGSYRGMRAYVTRMTDVSELEDWVERGVPVGLSLCYDRLRGKTPKPGGNGHLVVCVGFTEAGDPVINDPGTSQHVRKTFSRSNVISAWAYSRNTVYLVYPENHEVPPDRFGHWASWTSRQQLRFE